MTDQTDQTATEPSTWRSRTPRFTAVNVTPEMERAATERARQAAEESARSAAWLATYNASALGSTTATEATELDKTRRYLVPVGRLQLPDQPNVVHLTVYRWVPRVEEWFTGLALCGYSTEGEPLPADTVVTCAGCLKKKEDYDRYLAPGYRRDDDDPRALRAQLDILRKQAEASVELLTEFVALADVTHRYPIMGGHDCLGENLSCSGCALTKRIREHLERYR